MGCGLPSCWELWFQWPCYQPGIKKCQQTFWGYSVMLIGQGWDQNEKLARGYRKKCGMRCLRYCYETRIVRNTGTPAALCLTLVWSRNQIRLGIATLQFCNDRNGAGRTASCHERLSGSSMVSPVIKFRNPHLIPDLIPLPSCQASPISKQIEPLETRLGCIEMDVTETRSNISKKKIPEAQKVTLSFTLLAGWWYLLMKTPGRSLHKRHFDILIPSFERMIVCRDREREWLEEQNGGLKFWNVKLRGCWRHAGFTICKRQTGRLVSNSKYEATKFQLVFTRQLVLMKCMTWVMSAASQVLSLHKSGAPAQRRIPRYKIFPKWNLVQENTRHIIISFNFLNSKTSCNKKRPSKRKQVSWFTSP